MKKTKEDKIRKAISQFTIKHRPLIDVYEAIGDALTTMNKIIDILKEK